jgi:acyl carrier protein
VFLDALPLTPQGKVDRGALPRDTPGSERPHPARAMTAVEKALSQLWESVLGVQAIGPDDDFFEIGGHSLHATRLLALVRRAFRVELPMSALYEATTVAALARALIAHEMEPGHVERAARALSKLKAMRGEDKKVQRARGEAVTP